MNKTHRRRLQSCSCRHRGTGKNKERQTQRRKWNDSRFLAILLLYAKSEMKPQNMETCMAYKNKRNKNDYIIPVCVARAWRWEDENKRNEKTNNNMWVEVFEGDRPYYPYSL